jgi:hypothetical protein
MDGITTFFSALGLFILTNDGYCIAEIHYSTGFLTFGREQLHGIVFIFY